MNVFLIPPYIKNCNESWIIKNIPAIKRIIINPPRNNNVFNSKAITVFHTVSGLSEGAKTFGKSKSSCSLIILPSLTLAS